MLLWPDEMFHRIYEIPASFLQEKGVRTILLDVDNTLTTHDNPVPHEKILSWLETMREAGFRLMILSNNTPQRVAPFAEGLGLEYIADAHKPLSGPLKKALSRMGGEMKSTVLIGDQIFTDILCGNLAGCLSVLVEPMELEPMPQFKLKRFLERPILWLYRKTRRRKG